METGISHISVLHGDNQVLSRKRLGELKEQLQSRGVEIVVVDGKNVSFDQFQLASQTQLLLGESAVFVEEFWSTKVKNTSRQSSDKIQNYTKLISGNIVFWEPRELSSLIISSFPEFWNIQNFSISRKIFQFLDALGVGNAKTALMLLREVIKTDTEYIVLPTLAWYVRSMLCAKVDPSSLSGPSWKQQKLLNQAKKFDTQQLLALHAKLLRLDRSQKTGKLDIPLSNALDLVVADIYN